MGNVEQIDAVKEMINDVLPTKMSEMTIADQIIASNSNQAIAIKINKKTKSKGNRRFELGHSNAMTLKSSMKELRKLKKIKLNDLSAGAKKSYRQQCSESFDLPGQL